MITWENFVHPAAIDITVYASNRSTTGKTGIVTRRKSVKSRNFKKGRAKLTLLGAVTRLRHFLTSHTSVRQLVCSDNLFHWQCRIMQEGRPTRCEDLPPKINILL